MKHKVIGIDISKATFDVAFFEEGGWKHHVFSNNQQGFTSLFELLNSGDHCIMEASGPYYLSLAFFLHQHQVKVSVVNPLSIKRFSQMQLTRAKTDKKDAQVIADYGANQNPSLWKPASEVTLKMQQINTLLEAVHKQKTALGNQMEAFTSSGIMDEQVKQSLEGLLLGLKKEQKKLEGRLQQLVLGYYEKTYKHLVSIPGIGKKTAIMLIALTDDFKKFTHYKQLIAYVGFSPRVYQSGTSVKGKGHICKMGKAQIRKVLYMCSWTAKKNNKACIEMYNRLKAKGKPERVIKVAIANKLLKQAFAIGSRKEQFYDENFIAKTCF